MLATRSLPSLIRLGLGLSTLTLVACATTPGDGTLPAVRAQQWHEVELRSPFIAAAYLQSLIALSEDDPQNMARSRRQALELARQAGVLTVQPPLCPPCELPKNEQEVQRHVVCLANRLNCLRPR